MRDGRVEERHESLTDRDFRELRAGLFAGVLFWAAVAILIIRGLSRWLG